MPVKTWSDKQTRPVKAGLALAAALLLSGCVGDAMNGIVSRLPFRPEGQTAAVDPELSTDNRGALAEQPTDAGQVIDDLKARQGILPGGGAFATIAQAVLDNSTGAAAAELRIARLKAEAKEKNWLPQIGPSVNLTSLSGLVTSMLVEAAVFDNGRKRAEREYAAADVELAAVSLAEELNGRVHDALRAYVTAQRANEQAAIDARALARLEDYQGIMRMRVEGGLSDQSEQQIIDQHIAEMRATLAADQQQAKVATEELASLTGGPVAGLGGMDTLAADTAAPEPLAVLRARGDAARRIAGAKMDRASLLPGLTAQANVGKDGVDTGLALGVGQLMGLGTGDALAALAAVEDLAQREVAEAADTSRRSIEATQNDMTTIAMRQAQGAEVLRQTSGNLEMFVEQYKVGRRSLIELVAEFDGHARLERDQAALRYEVVLKRLVIARDRGVLLSGAQM